MRRTLSILTFTMIVIFSSCKEDKIEIKENFIKATINGNQLVIYENNDLNNDTTENSFSFSFGQGISTNKNEADTSLFLKASLNKQFLEVSFPTTTTAKKFEIYRSGNIMNVTRCQYSILQVYKPDIGIETFNTRNLLFTSNTDDQKVGEITIKKINWNSREVEGTFFFEAFGYLHKEGDIHPTNSSVLVTNGEFFYHWSDELKISY